MPRMTFTPWERAIILVDMNAFFASIEQLDRPEWRGRPLAVTNGLTGTCIITCSYEARAYGIKTGMRLKEGRKLCPDLIQCPARPQRYATVSSNIMQALQDITPDIEVFSVDEAFLDVTHCQRLLGPPERIAWLANLRSRVPGLPYGDQGLLIARDFYNALGGFRPLPLMEDVDLVRRIGRRRLVMLDATAVTSAERYRRGGFWLRPLRNQFCLLLWLLGVPVSIILRIYYR